MKKILGPRQHGYVAEWLQAIFTLVVLVSLYQYSLTYDPNLSPATGSESKNQISSYWNDSLGYGFRWDDGDTYKKSVGKALDTVSVSAWGASFFTGNNVQVSFYTDTPISDIKKLHTASVSKAYSRLSNGIAVIEWDLSSTRAKNVLATLHAR